MLISFLTHRTVRRATCALLAAAMAGYVALSSRSSARSSPAAR
jgi:hypothetical protein